MVVSFIDHFNLSIIPMCSSVFNDSKVCSSSEKSETQSVNTIMRCSIMTSDLRDLGASHFPRRKSCS